MDELLESGDQDVSKKKVQYEPNVKLKKERELRGWSQAMVAEKIAAQPKLINRWEIGHTFPSPFYREKLCQLFDKNAEELGLIKSMRSDLMPDILPATPTLSYEPVMNAFPLETPAVLSSRRGVFSRRVVVAGLIGGVAILGIGAFSWWETVHAKLVPSITYRYTYQPVPDYDINEVFWSPLGTYISSVNGDNRIQILDAATGAIHLTYSNHKSYVIYASWSPDETRIASASADTTVQVWSPTNGEQFFSYTGHKATVLCVAWSPDGSLIASSSKDGTGVHVWKVSDQTHIASYMGHTGFVFSISWVRNNSSIASCGEDGTIHVWDPMTGTPSPTFGYQGSRNGTIYEVTWSPDGKQLVSAHADSTVVIWDGLTGNHTYTYIGHTKLVDTARWSPDGNYIASGGADNTIQIWKASTGELLLTYTKHTKQVYEVAWSPDGKNLASCSEDHTIHVCSVSLDE